MSLLHATTLDLSRVSAFRYYIRLVESELVGTAKVQLVPEKQGHRRSVQELGS